MIARPDDYRARADECEWEASATRDSRIKAQFLDLARQWRELAAVAQQSRKTN